MVAIPARDEAAGIARTLRALGAQVGPDGSPLRGFTVLVLANNCRDDTARLAREAAPPGLRVQVTEVTLPPEQAGVVAARRLALDHAAALAGEDGVIVSTDADTRPAPQWLCALLRALGTGADAAAGRILLEPAQRAALPAAARRTHLIDSAYRQAVAEVHARLDPVAHDPWPRHWQHFGASLALRVRAYRAVGGVPEVRHLEDVALVGALRRVDLHVRHTPQARAWTSARLSGRVPVGLSTQLTQWAQAGGGWTVPGAAETLALARAEAALRGAWHAGCPADLPTFLPALWLSGSAELRAALSAPTFGLALEAAHRAREVGGAWHAAYPPVPVTQALAELRAALPGLRPLRPAGGPPQPTRSSTSSR
ncbi:glycosyltransferase [uncultured Deinococcus sp.]|uniref:glycosyltransferase n=1 Tax=uncultured Deinococcus sp. TaxID=158789 RepID=UPI0037498D66